MLNVYRCKIQPSFNDTIWPKAQVWNRKRLDTGDECLNKWLYFSCVIPRNPINLWHWDNNMKLETGNNRYMGCILKNRQVTIQANIITPHTPEELPQYIITTKIGEVDAPYPKQDRIRPWTPAVVALQKYRVCKMDYVDNWYKQTVKQWIADNLDHKWIFEYKSDQYILNVKCTDCPIIYFDGNDYENIFEAIKAMFVKVMDTEGLHDEYPGSPKKNG